MVTMYFTYRSVIPIMTFNLCMMKFVHLGAQIGLKPMSYLKFNQMQTICSHYTRIKYSLYEMIIIYFSWKSNIDRILCQYVCRSGVKIQQLDERIEFLYISYITISIVIFQFIYQLRTGHNQPPRVCSCPTSKTSYWPKGSKGRVFKGWMLGSLVFYYFFFMQAWRFWSLESLRTLASLRVFEGMRIFLYVFKYLRV